ncbi:hypothetical protein IFM89_032236 [Coptis chinensis]|uniref:Uncharacterized protein n=1 Tax=Coptis chinensis TaxID=261450 RepID=A0A835LTM3_9MAGN|nr:hypothetical protein IFM89_032236 [Coptis chinensis]
MASTQADDRESTDSSFINANREKHHSSDTTHLQVSDDILSRVDDRSGRVHPTLIAEVLIWTHALQRIHKQSLQLAKANNGEGPELLRHAHDAVNTISSTLPPVAKYRERSTSLYRLKVVGGWDGNGIDEVSRKPLSRCGLATWIHQETIIPMMARTFLCTFCGLDYRCRPTKVLGIKSKATLSISMIPALSNADGPPLGNYDEIGSMLVDMDSLPKYTSPDNGFRSSKGVQNITFRCRGIGLWYE